MGQNMRLDVFIHFPSEPGLERRLDRIETALTTLLKGQGKMTVELDRLTTEVAETRGVVDSAIALIGGMAQQIRDLSNDPAALTALADELDAQTNALAAAVAANSPPAPEPVA